MTTHRTVFFVSDRTGITAELLGRTLLTQFPDSVFTKITLPFVDTVEKAQKARETINHTASQQGIRPLVFTTLINTETRTMLASTDAFVMDLFEMFTRPLEDELGMASSQVPGLSHGISDHVAYKGRIDAVNFALSHDDGITAVNFAQADIILVGVSRVGKTPTCLYLAMQYGVRAANFPLTPDDFNDIHLPKSLRPFRKKLFGLTISPDRLSQIRSERKADSNYASPKNCLDEVNKAEAIFRAENIPFMDTTTKSVEEIATTIIHERKLRENPSR